MAHTLDSHRLEVLQSSPRHVRNICILAHVDHGKTTLSDGLISSNGIISPKLAGKIRYMDNTEDEQIRGITMKSSAISLLHYDRRYRELKQDSSSHQHHQQQSSSSSSSEANKKDYVPYLLNLIDSPGHVDFSSDVSTAVRISDGAVVVVDVIEGVCIQTHAVLRQAWEEGIRPCLVLNKMDRLLTELQLTPSDAYAHLCRIIEQVNVIVSSLFTAELLATSHSSDQRTETSGNHGTTDSNDTNTDGKDVAKGSADDELTARFESWAVPLDAKEEQSIFFSPSKGNVVFASAIDGWAFSTEDFAALFEERLNMKRNILRKAFWGNYAIVTKKDGQSKKVVSLEDDTQSKGKPAFVEYILETIWKIYDVTVMNFNEEKMRKIVKKLSIDVSSRELKQKEGGSCFQSIMRAWLPLAKAVLNMIVRVVPSPRESHVSKLKKLFPPLDRLQLQHSMDRSEFETFFNSIERVRTAVETCDTSDGAPCVLYVSKMVAFPRSSLPSDEESESAEFAPSELLPPRKSDLLGMPADDTVELATREEENLPSWYKSSDTETVLCNRIFPSGLIGSVTEPERYDEDTDSSIEKGYDASMEGAGEHDQTETFIAFARIFSGCLRPNTPLYILGPKYDPGNPFRDHSAHITQTSAPIRLYMMMGRDINPLRKITAGNIVGIKGLGNHILKTATVSTTPLCPSLVPMTFQSTPLVRVAIEPKHVTHMSLLQKGLRLLNQADPSVEVTTTATGEMQLAAIGELHLERCVRELENRFAGIKVVVSEPITTFKETITKQLSDYLLWEKTQQNNRRGQVHQKPEDVADENEHSTSPEEELLKPGCHICVKNGAVYATTSDGKLTIVLQAFPMPKALAEFLNSRTSVIKQLFYRLENHSKETAEPYDNGNKDAKASERSTVSPQTTRFLKELSRILEHEDPSWGLRLREMWAFGPRGVGPNILAAGFDSEFAMRSSAGEGSSCSGSASREGGHLPRLPSEAESLAAMKEKGMKTFWEEVGLNIEGNVTSSEKRDEFSNLGSASHRYLANLRSYFDQGFQLATYEGPMAAEPTWGLHYVVRDVIFHNGLQEAVAEGAKLNTRVITLMKNACHKAFESGSQRIVEAMYKCELHCSGGRSGGGEQLGKLYSVLHKRRGRVISEDILEGTTTFQVVAYLPVVESFGFGTDLRKQTSGAATSPQLMFSHWEVLDVDPYFQPKTEEEQEEYGSEFHEDQFVNVAKDLIDRVRRRKGLDTERKIVIHAEKQRTLGKKK